MEDYYFTILWWFWPYIDMNQPWLHMRPPILNPLPPPSPSYPSGLSQSPGFVCPASHSKLALVIYFTYGNTHVSVLFSQLIPPSPSPTRAQSCSSHLSLLLPCIQDHHYRLSKFRMYVLIHSIGVSLSDLLHSV